MSDEPDELDAHVDWIVQEMRRRQEYKPAMEPRAPAPGLDLSGERLELRNLLLRSKAEYRQEMHLWSLRNDPANAEKWLPYEQDEPEVVHDFSAFEGDGFENIDIKAVIGKRGRGRPRISRSASVPPPEVAPELAGLDSVYLELRRWFRARGKRFNPNFDEAYRALEDEKDGKEDEGRPWYHESKRRATIRKVYRQRSELMPYFNPAARLFLLIVQWLDGRYTVANCNTIYQDLRKKYPVGRRSRKAEAIR